MPTTLDQILPSLQSLGMWSYWIIGLSSMLEAFFVSGIIIPGTLVVEAGGILVQNNVLDFFDLAWFVAIGSFLGGELSFWAGVAGARTLKGRWDPTRWKYYERAERLFQRHGGSSLILGRFLGPVSGLVPFAAALAHMDRRKFIMWNAISAVVYALSQLAFGYFLGNVLASLGPLATRVALFAVVAGVLLAILWYLVLRVERTLPFVVSILGSMLRAAGENPDVRAWAARHPRVTRFLAQRFDTRHFQGLTATFLGVLFLYVLIVWFSAVFHVLLADPIVQTDQRLAELVHVFWTPWLLDVFAHITALGDWKTVTVLFVGAVGALYLRREFALLSGLVVAVIGNVVLVTLLKILIARPRPELAYFVETSGSFPSGHAAISVAFYGMLFYILWRRKFIGPVVASLLASTVAFVIGLSRIYLIEHYLSDVMNGFLVGAMWLLVGIALCEFRAQKSPVKGRADAPPPMGGYAPLGVLALAVLAAGVVNVTYHKARNVAPVSVRAEVVTNIDSLFSSGKALPATESVGGVQLEPISLVFSVKSEADFSKALQKAGWIKAQKPGLRSLATAAWAAATNRPDDVAPVTPYFWSGLPNDFAYQKPTPDQTLRKRHHARFWKTRFVTAQGDRIIVGAASFDDGINWDGLHHIDPNIDAERDMLISDMKKAGVVKSIRFFQLSTPHLGQDVAGDPWFTDGRAVIVRLK